MNFIIEKDNDMKFIIEKDLETIENYAKSLVKDSEFVVFEWDNAPEMLRNLCCYNGGDEDWMVLVRKEPEYLPAWIWRMDSLEDPDTYVLNGIVIYVGSHA